LIRSALFFVTFSIEVRVKAAEVIDGLVSEPETPQISTVSSQAPFRLRQNRNVIQQPEGCLHSSGPCAFSTGPQEKFSFDYAGGVVVLDRETALLRVSDSELRLMRGSIFLKTEQNLHIGCEFGWVDAAKPSELWLSKTADQFKILAVNSASSSGAILHPLGTSETLQVPTGMMNWLGAVGVDGRSQSGIPVAIALEVFLKDWARVYSGSLGQFEKDARVFYERWSEASQTAAELHRALYVRKVATLNDDFNREQARRKKVEDRNRYFREMFRRKVFEE